MDIRKDTIGVQAVQLLRDIADSHFVAFDFEFSGVESRTRPRTREGKPNLDEHYKAVRAAVQQFQPLQIGLTIAKLDQARGRYVLEPYNFNINPVPFIRERYFTRTWSMQSGAVSFLQNHGFDFQQQFLYGVPYISWQEESEVRENMAVEAKRQDMELKAHDQPLVTHIRNEIAKWQATPKDEQEEFLNIPNGKGDGVPAELNRYQMRLVHQVVENEFSAMKTKGMGHFVQITNPTAEQQTNQRLLEEQYRERDISRAIGFRWILDAMVGRDISKLPVDWLSEEVGDDESARQRLLTDLTSRLNNRNKVLVGHNCFTDLMFLYKMIAGDLPPTVEEFTDRLHDMFPALIDTKYLAMSYHDKYGRNALGEVERELRSETIPEIHTSGDFDRYINDAYLHEAGYDSYITAIVAIKLAAKLHKEGSLRKNDHDRQAQGVAQAAATQPQDFGVQDTYVTAPECNNSPDAVTSPSTPQPRLPPLSGITANFSNSPVSTDDTANRGSTRSGTIEASQSAPPTMIPASILPKTVDSQANNSTTTVNADQTSSLESKLATLSTSTPSASSSRDPEMSNTNPRESNTTLQAQIQSRVERRENEETEAEKATRLKISDMVKRGELMPRWHEERGFWEFYGNRLQMNGTVEGSLKVA